MRSNVRIPITALALVSLSLLCSCGGPAGPVGVKDGAYRVQTKELKNDADGVTREYVIETSSKRTLSLARESGSDSSTIAPDTIKKERTAKANAKLTITMQGAGADRQVVFEVIVESSTAIAQFRRELSVPPDAALRSILKETKTAGDVTAKTTLLRAASGDKFVELSIE